MQRAKKRAFTIVEVMVAISIVTLLLSISVSVISIYKKVQIQSSIDSYLLSIKSKLIYYKNDCLNNNYQVYFKIQNNGDIKITNKKYKVIEEIQAPQYMTMVFGGGIAQTNTTEYLITPSGTINQSGTIGFRRGDEKYAITISVGDEVIRIYSPYKYG